MIIKTLKNYQDDRNNKIEYNGKEYSCEIYLSENSKNNKLTIHDEAQINYLKIQFCCNNACVTINKVSDGKFFLQLGENCNISIGNEVTCTGITIIFTAEGTKCTIGNDVMLASNVKIKTHDHHPIFDINSKNRVNQSKDIIIRDHVWICDNAYIGKGSIIEEGSVIGYGSFVTSTIPNNCIATGIPARVIKTNIAWERPLLNWAEPFYKNNASSISISNFWNPTIKNPFTAQKIKHSLTREHIIWAYRLFLEREPENEAVVESKLSDIKTLRQLRMSLLESQEYKNNETLHKQLHAIHDNRINIIFLHLQKTFGTAFNNFLRKTFGNACFDMKQFLDARSSAPGREQHVFTGHVDFNFYKRLIIPERTLFLSVVRHPVERACSWHNFHKDEYWKGKRYSLKEAFAIKNEHAMANCFSNSQCRNLTGKHTFAEAKAVIESNNFLIGCFSYPDIFMKKCCDVFACPPATLEKMNVASEPSYMESYKKDTELLDLLYEYNMEDIKLYAYVKKRQCIANFITPPEMFRCNQEG